AACAIGNPCLPMVKARCVDAVIPIPSPSVPASPDIERTGSSAQETRLDLQSGASNCSKVMFGWIKAHFVAIGILTRQSTCCTRTDTDLRPLNFCECRESGRHGATSCPWRRRCPRPREVDRGRLDRIEAGLSHLCPYPAAVQGKVGHCREGGC